MAITNSKKFYYVLLQKKKLVVINEQLPIFWDKRKADTQAKKVVCDVVRISGTQLEKLILESIK